MQIVEILIVFNKMGSENIRKMFSDSKMIFIDIRCMFLDIVMKYRVPDALSYMRKNSHRCGSRFLNSPKELYTDEHDLEDFTKK